MPPTSNVRVYKHSKRYYPYYIARNPAHERQLFHWVITDLYILYTVFPYIMKKVRYRLLETVDVDDGEGCGLVGGADVTR